MDDKTTLRPAIGGVFNPIQMRNDDGNIQRSTDVVSGPRTTTNKKPFEFCTYDFLLSKNRQSFMHVDFSNECLKTVRSQRFKTWGLSFSRSPFKPTMIYRQWPVHALISNICRAIQHADIVFESCTCTRYTKENTITYKPFQSIVYSRPDLGSYCTVLHVASSVWGTFKTWQNMPVFLPGTYS